MRNIRTYANDLLEFFHQRYKLNNKPTIIFAQDKQNSMKPFGKTAHYDPAEQSIWTTDTSRLTYVVKQLISNNSTKWIIDKKGVETKKYIITPLIKKIQELATDYHKSQVLDVDFDECSQKEIDKMTNINEKYKNFVANVLNGKLHEDILKYLSPHLSFNNKKVCKSLEL